MEKHAILAAFWKNVMGEIVMRENISSLEVENMLYTHPAVFEALGTASMPTATKTDKFS